VHGLKGYLGWGSLATIRGRDSAFTHRSNQGADGLGKRSIGYVCDFARQSAYRLYAGTTIILIFRENRLEALSHAIAVYVHHGETT
jgi:hypothetical protein